MEQEIKIIKVSDLVLWTENPRDPISKDAKDQDVVNRALTNSDGTWDIKKFAKSMGDTYDFSELPTVFFFLNRTNVSGVIKGGIIGGISQQGKYKIDARFNKNNLIERIKYIASFKNNIELSKLDGIAFLKALNRKQRDIFFYIDPPYVEKGANLYLNFYNNNDHVDLAKVIKKIRKKWLVSYDNNELIPELYSRYRILKYNLSQCTSNRIGNELLVFSKGIEFSTSIQYLKNPVML